MDLGLMKFLLKSLKYPFNISHFFSFSHKKIQLSLHMLPILCKVKLLPLVFLFLLSAAIFGYCSNQVCLSFSFSFRLFASFFFFFFNFINFLLVIHESDIQCFCTPKNQNKLHSVQLKNLKVKRNKKLLLELPVQLKKKIVFRYLKVRIAGKLLQNCCEFEIENCWRTQICFLLCFLFDSSVIYEASGVLHLKF